MKKRNLFPFFLAFSLGLTGCGSAGNTDTAKAVDSTLSFAGSDQTESDGQTSNDTNAANGADTSDMFTDRDYEIGYDESESTVITLNGQTASCSSDSVQISGSTITLTEEGTYIVSGSLDDGMIIIDAGKTDKIQLVLNGVTIHSGTSAPVYVRQADKVFITLAADSENTLSNGGEFVNIDENNIDSVIFSKDDLTLNGFGSLTITSPAGHGIVSKDDLVFTSGTYNITAGSHGISGKDSVRIGEGNFVIHAGKDGIHAENSDDASLGFLYISGGSFDITADGDGMSGESYLQIEKGTFTILAGGGSETAAVASSENTASTKGIKSSGNLIINGGDFFIDSADDAVHSNADLSFNGGNAELATGDDGFHADGQMVITDGTILITKSYEGIEGLSVDISGGDITLTSRDDGVNAAGGNDSSGFGGFRADDSFSDTSESCIHISGGILRINASGDGIDSNGDLFVSGGETYVSGPTDGGNGALDYDGKAEITGGVVIAVGSSRMSQNFGSSSTQGSILVNCTTQEAGSRIELIDSDGQILLSWETEKPGDTVIVSCPEIVQGGTYTLNIGSYSTEITMDSLIYGSGGGMKGGGMKGGPMGDDSMRGGPMEDGPAGDGSARDGFVRGGLEDGSAGDGSAQDGFVRGGPMEDGPAGDGSARDGFVKGGLEDGSAGNGPIKGGMKGGIVEKGDN